MTKQQYVRQIVGRIHANAGTRRRIRTDLLAGIAAKEEAGLTMEQIQAEMGSPEKVAAEFNASFAGTSTVTWYRRQRIARTAFLVLVVLAVLVLLFSGLGMLAFLAVAGPSVGIIGGADGPTSIYVTGEVVTGTPSGGIALLLVLAGLAILCLAAWLICRNRKP